MGLEDLTICSATKLRTKEVIIVMGTHMWKQSQITSKPARQRGSKPSKAARQQASKAASHQAIKPASQQASKPAKPAHQQLFDSVAVHAGLLPCCLAGLLACCLAALLPCCLAAVLPCCLAALLPCFEHSTGRPLHKPAKPEIVNQHAQF